ncbi:TPA: HPF/RaiA family ribosome-associated protein [Clostridioides difficile]|uniref:HPF/RaiA family ribosome-associated protein n=1 Tax=Clostridioides difficile TaxID=1496 RepID=UPI001C17DFA5|nr:HPF/RaiA family ribosome-associated protein [Clostridioides difficile]
MDIKIIKKHNKEISKDIELAIHQKLNFLEVFLKENDYIKITVEQNKLSYKIELLLEYNKKIIKMNEVSEDFFSSLEKITNRLKRKLYKIYHMNLNVDSNNIPFKKVIKTTNKQKKEDIKRKQIKLKPMSEEEAFLQMELLGYSYFLFYNQNFIMSLIHLNKNGQYELIEGFLK